MLFHFLLIMTILTTINAMYFLVQINRATNNISKKLHTPGMISQKKDNEKT